MNFSKGDIGYHKATNKRCVVSNIGSDGHLFVTTEDGVKTAYQPEELWTEQEWEMRNANAISSSDESFRIGQ